MKRKQFLLTTLAATPLLSFSKNLLFKENTKKPFKVGAGKSRFNETLTYRNVNTQDIKVSHNDTDNMLGILEYTGHEKVGPPLHVHFYEDEIFYIVEGSYRFVVGNNEFEAHQGDIIFLPRNIPHTWVQLTDKGKQLYMLSPSVHFENFLRKLQSLSKPPTEEELQEIHMQHGMKILGPPLQP